MVIAVPTISSVILIADNRAMRSRLDATVIPSDDAVTVGATQLEPASIAKEKPVLGYQIIHPEFKASFDGFDDNLVAEKTVFLTFDDGPSTGTPEILEILRKRDVKATFFVNGKSNRVLSEHLKRISLEGHAIGMHSYSHKYNTIYASMDNLLEDFYRNYRYIVTETGKAPEIMRFPGGSINIFNVGTYQPMVAEFLRRGFIYYDWNVSAGDAINDATTASIISNVTNGVRLTWGPSFILMHDNGKNAVRDALGPIIDTLAKEGYTFRALDNSIKPPMFIYPD